MATPQNLVISYIHVSQSCKDCGGKCYDKNQLIRHANFRSTFPDKQLPEKCVNTCTGRVKCPLVLGAL